MTTLRVSSMNDDDLYLETEMDAEDATGPAAAALLESVASTLDQAPTDRRFNVELEITEK